MDNSHCLLAPDNWPLNYISIRWYDHAQFTGHGSRVVYRRILEWYWGDDYTHWPQ